MDSEVMFYFLFLVLVTGIDVSMDKSRYEDGRREYELISQRSEIPRYGVCWKNAMITIQRGCKHLTDDIQGRLALAYLNCFLEFQGRTTYECQVDQPLSECTQNMLDVDRGSYTTFFTHTQNICYFLQAQVWAEATENTIDRLSDSSSQVASRLEDANKLQGQVLKQQEESMKNQEAIMNQASNLSNIISSSSQNIHALFEDYKKTTQEQQMLMTDVFERITKLQHFVIGEFSGFYSIVYYALAVLVCYLLTSTPRTSNARFWLFGLMTVNMMAEQTIISVKPNFLQYLNFSKYQDEEELIYTHQRFCRRISATVGMVILAFSAYLYKDLNTINNQLLVEIRRQNSELKRCLMENVTGTQQMLTVGAVSAEADSTVESDSASLSDSGGSSDEDSDRTFILNEESSKSSHSSSFYSVMTDSMMSHISDLFQNEVRDLRQSTPIKQLPEHIQSWVTTGHYPGHSPRPDPFNSPSQAGFESPRYYLRPRKPVISSPNPALKVESPNSFAKTVRNLEDITRKNSILARAVIGRGVKK